MKNKTQSWFYLAGIILGISTVAPVQAQNQISQISQQQLTKITEIQLSVTERGLEIFLLTEGGLLSLPVTERVGKELIAEIDQAILALPNNEPFQAVNPTENISSVRVASLENNRIRIVIIGTDTSPILDTQDTPQGLVLTAIPDAIAATEEPIELVVTATRTEEDILDVPRSITVIDREDIAEQSLNNNDLGGILGELVPGFGPPPENNRTRAFNLRGRPALILIDGVPQNSNTSFDTQLSSIDPSIIDRIEVVRGPSAVYGEGASGGIVNIITRQPEGTQSNVAITLRPDFDDFDEAFNYKLQGGVSQQVGNFDFLLSTAFDADQSTFDAEGDRVPPDGLSDDNETFDIFTKFGLDIGEEQRLQLSYNFFNNNFESEFISDPAILQIEGDQKARALEVGEIDFEQSPRQQVHNLNLSYRHENLINSTIDAQLYYRETDLQQIISDIRDRFPPGSFPAAPQLFQTSLVDASELGVRLQADTTLNSSLSLLWGADFAHEENETRFLALDPEAFDQNQEANVIDELTQAPPYDIDSLGLFAQLQWEISDRWSFNGGLRYETINVDIDDYTASPFSNPTGDPAMIEGGSIDADEVVFNAGLVYRVSPDVGIFANFSQGFSIPALGFTLGAANFGGATAIDDNILALEPQKVDNYEIGIRGNWDNVEVSLAGFFNESDLGTALIVEEGLTSTQRAPQRNYGLELAVDWTASTAWQLGGSFTWNEGEFDDPTDDEEEFVALSSIDVQPLKLTLYAENQTLPRWRNRLQALIVGSRDRAFDDGVDNFTVDGYTLFSFISTVELNTGRLEFAIDNLFNEQYLPVTSQERIGIQEVRRLAGSGRTFSVRYGVEF
jgi:iron complex outermembrane receptor protein